MSAFDRATASLRPEMLAHCYRMLGSWDDAEDAVQDAYLRAFRGWDAFEHRSSVRTWLYAIATNVCLNAARDRGRRALPRDLTTTTDDAATLSGRPADERWVQPFASDRDDVRLAMIAALQRVPASQRAVLLLCEVLQFATNDVARMLDATVPAVKGRLQRARAALGGEVLIAEDVIEPTAAESRRLLDVYMRAFETAEVQLLTAVLRNDAVLDLVPSGMSFNGKDECTVVLTEAVGHPGDWTMQPTSANGQPAALAHLEGHPYGVAVLDIRADGIASITVFEDPALLARFR